MDFEQLNILRRLFLRQKTSSAAPGAGETGHVKTARQSFEGVCADTRKAWLHTGLTGRLDAERFSQLHTKLSQANASELVQYMSEMISPMMFSGHALGEVHSGQSAGHLAAAIVESLLEPAVTSRLPNEALCMTMLKELAMHWIDHGDLPEQYTNPYETSQAKLISQLACKDCHSPTQASHLRLMLLAPMVPVMETMSVISGLDPQSLQASFGGVSNA